MVTGQQVRVLFRPDREGLAGEPAAGKAGMDPKTGPAGCPRGRTHGPPVAYPGRPVRRRLAPSSRSCPPP
jgi:hypothetical protein